MNTYTYRNLNTLDVMTFTAETYVMSLQQASDKWFGGSWVNNFTATKSGRVIVLKGKGNNHYLQVKWLKALPLTNSSHLGAVSEWNTDLDRPEIIGH